MNFSNQHSGVSRLMWGSDYPDREGTFPSTIDFSIVVFDRGVDAT
jgi:hypothetical protein